MRRRRATLLACADGRELLVDSVLDVVRKEAKICHYLQEKKGIGDDASSPPVDSLVAEANGIVETASTMDNSSNS